MLYQLLLVSLVLNVALTIMLACYKRRLDNAKRRFKNYIESRD